MYKLVVINQFMLYKFNQPGQGGQCMSIITDEQIVTLKNSLEYEKEKIVTKTVIENKLTGYAFDRGTFPPEHLDTPYDLLFCLTKNNIMKCLRLQKVVRRLC